MLPSELLRVRIKGYSIRPIYAGLSYDNLFLADMLIEAYEESVGKKVRDLLEKLRELEDMAEAQGFDFRFFRGLKTLLDRRLVLEDVKLPIDPIRVRAEVFKASNELYGGYVISEDERNDVIKRVAARLNLSKRDVEVAIMCIYDEEKIIRGFELISGKDLLKLYNLSLTQTLLFRCIRLFLYGKATGYNMKRFLWSVKRLGLLYMAEQVDGGISLVIDGPMSILKQTERYGTRLAKLIPLVLSLDKWRIKAYVTRKLRFVKGDVRKVYKFVLTDKAKYLFPSPKPAELTFDSEVERDFAHRFEPLRGGWSLIREPEPIVVGRSIFIPDFMLTRGNLKVYLEIVGFWTEDYLRKKLEKLKMIKDLNLIIAIDSTLGDVDLKGTPHIVIKYKRRVPVHEVLKQLRKFEKPIPKARKIDIKKVKLDKDLEGITLKDAYEILKGLGVKEEEVQRVIESLGYKVIWRGIDPRDAIIKKVNSK